MISKTIGYNGVHNIFRHTHMTHMTHMITCAFCSAWIRSAGHAGSCDDKRWTYLRPNIDRGVAAEQRDFSEHRLEMAGKGRELVESAEVTQCWGSACHGAPPWTLVLGAYSTLQPPHIVSLAVDDGGPFQEQLKGQKGHCTVSAWGCARVLEQVRKCRQLGHARARFQSHHGWRCCFLHCLLPVLLLVPLFYTIFAERSHGAEFVTWGKKFGRLLQLNHCNILTWPGQATILIL